MYLEAKFDILTSQKNMYKIHIANIHKTTQQDIVNNIVSRGYKLTHTQYGLRDSRRIYNHLHN